MAMVIGEMMYSDLDFSTHSSTTTSEADKNWKELSPVVDWDIFSGDEFNDLMESMMDDEVCGVINLGCNSDSTAATTLEMDDETNSGDVKGLKLVHLLMAAAEALTGSNKSCELARVILVRLKELVSPTDGTNMERLTAYFTEALQGLMDGAVNGTVKHLANATHGQSHHRHHPTDVVAAFQLLQDMSPYMKFGHFTANQAILESTVHDRRVHIIDYDIMEGIQWASLMQALVSRRDGPPAPHLRITALSRCGSSRRSIGTVYETGRRLISFAASIGLSFSFHQCKLDSDQTFKPAALKLVKGEALVVNCMLHLPDFDYRAPNSVTSFLSGAQSLKPRLVTLVEEEIGNMVDAEGFLGRFMDTLQHYSAVYDSLEAGFPIQARARALVERVFLVPRIGRSLARIYRQSGEEAEAEGSWGEWLSSAGYRPVPVSFANHCQAKLLIGLFNDGYRVEELASNRLVLGWKSRKLLSASIWSTSDNNNTFSQ